MIIKNKKQLKSIVKQYQSLNQTVLIKKGVFDILHPGHIYALKQFDEIAGIVIIFVQSDELTKKKKGSQRPINRQKQRAEILDAIKYVDYVYLDKSLSSEEYIALLKEIEPSLIAVTKGDKEKTKRYTNKRWKLVEFEDKKLPTYSTTNIINRIKQTNI